MEPDDAEESQLGKGNYTVLADFHVYTVHWSLQWNHCWEVQYYYEHTTNKETGTFFGVKWNQ